MADISKVELNGTTYNIKSAEKLPMGVLAKLNLKKNDVTTKTWKPKTWGGTELSWGNNMWSDGENIYYSGGSGWQYVLDRSTDTWIVKEWNIVIDYGNDIWTDGYNIYYSYGSKQYVLDKSTSTWSTKTWTGLTSFDGTYIWSDGDNIYYSNGAEQYVLDKSTSTWETKTWTGLTSFYASYIWTDGKNYYYSYYSSSTTPVTNQRYVLNKSTSTWNTKTWYGAMTGFTGSYIWTDGENIYYSSGSSQRKLDVATSTWSTISWSGVSNLYGMNIWSDGKHIYYDYKDTSVTPNVYYNYVLDSVDPTGREVMGYVDDRINRFVTCSTAASTAAKTVSITSGTFSLEAGARITVKFTNANTAFAPTLNVNSNGAKNIYSKGSQITTGSDRYLLAGTVDFIYDGTQWHLIGNYIDTNTIYSVATTFANGLMSSGDKTVVDKLSSTAYTAMTPGDTNVTILNGGYIIIGKLCIVNMAFTVESGTAPSILFNDAPNPLYKITIPLTRLSGVTDATITFDGRNHIIRNSSGITVNTTYEINTVFMIA